MIVSQKKQKIVDPCSVGSVISSIIQSYDEFEQEKEHFYVIGLNNKNVIQYVDLVSIGTISESIVHPREVFRMAIHKGISSIIISHNHPSGDLNPSKEDLNVTERLKNGGDLLGIKLLDHVIVDNNNNFKSLQEKGHI